MFHGLWLFLLVTLTLVSLATRRRPVTLRLPRGFWLVNLALAVMVSLFVFIGLRSVFGAVRPFLEVTRVHTPWPVSGALIVGNGDGADLRLYNRQADASHFRLTRVDDRHAALLPLSDRRRVEVDGFDAGAVDLGRVRRIRRGDEVWTVGEGGWRSIRFERAVGEAVARGSMPAALLGALPGAREKYEIEVGTLYEGGGLTLRDPGDDALPGTSARLFRRDGRSWIGFRSPRDRSSSRLEVELTDTVGWVPIQTIPWPVADGETLTVGHTRYQLRIDAEGPSLEATARAARLELPLEAGTLRIGGATTDSRREEALRLGAQLEPPALLWFQAARGGAAQVASLWPGYRIERSPAGAGSAVALRGTYREGNDGSAPARDGVAPRRDQDVPALDQTSRAGDGGARAGDGGARAGDGGARAGDGAARAGDGAARAGDGGARAGDGATRAGDGATRAGDGATRAGDGPTRAADGGVRVGDGAARAADGADSGTDDPVEGDSSLVLGSQPWAAGSILSLVDSHGRAVDVRYQSSFVPATGGLAAVAPFSGWWRLLAAAAATYLVLTVALSILRLLSPDNFLFYHLTALLIGVGAVLLAQLGLHSSSLQLEVYGPRQLQALFVGLTATVCGAAWIGRGRRRGGRREGMLEPGAHPFDRLGAPLWVACPWPGGLIGRLARVPRVWALYLLALALLILQLPFGETGISIPGLGSIQPIEAVKSLLLVYFAWWTARVVETKAARLDRPERLGDRVSYLLHVAPVVLILLLSYGLDDISPILILSVFLYLMYRLSLVRPALGTERRVRLFDSFALEQLLLLFVLPALLYLYVLPHRASVYRRFLVWDNPWLNTGESSQIVGSLWSMLGVGGGGGLTGAGLGTDNGPLVPAVQDDFILAFLGNRLGLAGIALLMLTWVLYLLAGVRAMRSVSLETRPDLGTAERIDRVRLLMAGGLMLLTVQLAVVFGSVTGGLPVVGQPLPFLSAGGSHLALFCLPVAASIVLGARWRTTPGTGGRRPWA